MEAIFKEIVSIMQHDYSGCKDKIGWDRPDFYLEKIRHLEEQNQLTRKDFTDIVRDYLLDFNDHHIYFKNADSKQEILSYRGFTVRRFDEKLYVTSVDQENRVEKGMEFTTLGGHSIPILKELHKRNLNVSNLELEDWNPILSFYDYGEMEDLNGNLIKIPFQFYSRPPYFPTHRIEQIADDTVLLTMTDFTNPDTILKMIQENKELLENSDFWVIDMRINYGGSDASFYPLLEYIMPEEGIELYDEDDSIEFFHTKNNLKRQQAQIEEQLHYIVDEEVKQYLYTYKEEWVKNEGKGYVKLDVKQLIPETFIIGKLKPKSIVVLSDVMCGSSGDSFVELCKKSNKVKVIGRPTKGLNDYSNLVCEKWSEGFELWYPTSRLSRIDKGQGMTGKGIVPHFCIPWTPQHLVKDVDLEAAFEWIERSRILK